MGKTTYSPEERKARLESAHAELTSAVQAIATSDDWRAFLEFARKLHTYSAQNRMWLFQQAMMRGWDDLGHVAGFRCWLSLGRYVRKGEHGLAVLAPVRVKMTAEEGSESWVLRGFKVEHVFAACQTDGEGEIPELATGGYSGGRPPFGWRAEGKELVPDEPEQEVIALARRLSDEGLSSRQVAARLEEAGHRPKVGERWSSVQVCRILRERS